MTPIGTPIPQFDPYDFFNAFYTNSAIASMANREMWTVASKEKIPHNIKLAAHTKGRVLAYATAHDATQMTTLGEVARILPHAANVTGWLDVNTCGFFCIDIEKTCPPDLAESLIELWAKRNEPCWLEVSASGEGYHLIMKAPDNFTSSGLAGVKSIKHPSTFFEILFTHWTIFTRQEYDADTHHPRILERPHVQKNNLNRVDRDFFSSIKTIEQFLEHMKRYANTDTTKITHSIPRSASYTSSASMLNLDYSDEIDNMPGAFHAVHENNYLPYGKTLNDFNGDSSRWEYGYLCHLNRELVGILKETSQGHQYSYSTIEHTVMLYETAKKYLPYREKHQQKRGETNWLMRQCASVTSRNPLEQVL